MVNNKSIKKIDAGEITDSVGDKNIELLQKQKSVETEKPFEKSSELLTDDKNKKEGNGNPKFISAILQKKKPVVQPIRDEVTVKIEKIMEEGLGDAYERLSPIAKQEFKLKGEQTAIKIRELLQKTHVKAKKILRLILDWLRILPGINHFFVEQEAKIKTERIIRISNSK
jgi:hypothetical protein